MKNHTKQTLVLTCNDVQHIIRKIGLDTVMDDLIANLEEALRHYHADETQIPVRSGFHYQKPHTGLVEWMPLMRKNQEVTIKVVGYHPDNPNTYSLPTILSTISTYDVRTGHLSGIMDGVLPTALRTGASSAVASKLLAHKDSHTLGIIGCGAQAVTQIHALSRCFDLHKILIYDVSPKAMLSLAERCIAFAPKAQIEITALEEVVRASDILCTATSIQVGEGPLFHDIPTQAHVHINAVGSDFPGKTELSKELLQKSFVCPDFKAQAICEGECQQLSEAHIAPDWVQVIKHPEDYLRVKSQKSVFDSTGWALEDQVVMSLFMQYAEEFSIGQKLEIESIPDDAHNPYEFLRVSMHKEATE